MTFFEILMSLSVSLIQSPNNSRKSAINLVDKGLYATMKRWRIDPFCESRMTKNDTTRHEKALLIVFIRYQRKETKHFIRCHRIKNTVFILRYRIKFVLLPQKVSIWKRNCFER